MQKSHGSHLKKLGKEIKRLRIQNSITQQELAGRCDVDIRTIQRIENGEHGMGLHILISIAESLNITPSELLLCLK
jgi:transcriptional regulator with XRE-family HTH domain